MSLLGISGDLGAKEIIRLLDMQPHPEGGWYRRTFEDVAVDGARPASTAIYYLLEAEQMSAWHRVDAVEVWHYHAGAPISLSLSPPDGKGVTAHVLGPDLRAGMPAAGGRADLAGGRPPSAWEPGPWSAARSRQAFGSKASNWLRRTGAPRPETHTGRPEAIYRTRYANLFTAIYRTSRY
jgi:hypothetical protein